MEPKITLTDAIAKITELLESCCSIDRSDYTVKIGRVTRKVQRLTDFVESKDLKLQTMLGLVEKTRRLREKLSKLKRE